MLTKDFNPWKNVDEFDPDQFEQMSSELVQWPIKLWQAPVLSPYYHHAHLLIAADCSAFSYPKFHNTYAKGKVPLICCGQMDYDIAPKLSKIFMHNDIRSVTVVKMEAECCCDLLDFVKEALKASRLPIPLQVATVFISAEDVR
ncbi:MAG: hypothetical protein ACI3VP_06745 [Oscillospiraceae bacterium]